MGLILYPYLVFVTSQGIRNYLNIDSPKSRKLDGYIPSQV